jgi:transposase
MKNSQLCPPPELRGRWYLQVEKHGKSVKEVCDIFGISRKTYYKWYRRDHPFGKTGKPPKRTHPHTKITGQVQVKIYDAKIKYNFGPKKMSIYLKDKYGIDVAPSPIYRYYKKKKLIRKPQKHQKWYTPLKEPYYAEMPGENVQLDVKYVPGKEQTWLYQFRFIDTVTNLQYSVDMECKDSATTITTFKQAKRYFPFTITGIQTDNGGEFRGKFHDYLVRQKIVHRYIPKRSSPWNGKVERANRSVDDEYYLNWGRPWKTLAQYTRWYNHERPHLGKGMHGMTPHQKYLSLVR